MLVQFSDMFLGKWFFLFLMLFIKIERVRSFIVSFCTKLIMKLVNLVHLRRSFLDKLATVGFESTLSNLMCI